MDCIDYTMWKRALQAGFHPVLGLTFVTIQDVQRHWLLCAITWMMNHLHNDVF